MRRPVKNRNIVTGEVVYNSERLAKFINCVMKDGKKNTARKIVYQALDDIKKKAKTDAPIEIFEAAIRNAGQVAEMVEDPCPDIGIPFANTGAYLAKVEADDGATAVHGLSE